MAVYGKFLFSSFVWQLLGASPLTCSYYHGTIWLSQGSVFVVVWARMLMVVAGICFDSRQMRRGCFLCRILYSTMAAVPSLLSNCVCTVHSTVCLNSEQDFTAPGVDPLSRTQKPTHSGYKSGKWHYCTIQYTVGLSSWMFLFSYKEFLNEMGLRMRPA